jgi:hypothetical protein
MPRIAGVGERSDADPFLTLGKMSRTTSGFRFKGGYERLRGQAIEIEARCPGSGGLFAGHKMPGLFVMRYAEFYGLLTFKY